MAVIAATLAGKRVTRARVQIPKWGAWYADVSVDGESSLTGAVELVLADVTFHGTILSGGAAAGRSDYRIVGGAGGWGKIIPAKGYASDAGVKLSTILGDAAREAGETLIATALGRSVAGPAFARQEGPAGRVLELLAPGNWYVDSGGITRIGTRATSVLERAVPRTSPVDLAAGTVTLAPAAIATIVPGITVDGLEAVDVQHELSAEGGLRTRIWGPRGGATSRLLQAQRKVFEALFPDIQYRGVTEYRVISQNGERLDLQPVRVSTGMPVLLRVPVRPGVPGASATHSLSGAVVLVQFVDASPARPVVTSFEDADGGAFLPLALAVDASTFIKLGAGIKPVAVAGDLAGGVWPIIPTQVKVLA